MAAPTPGQPFRLVHVGTFHPADQAAGLTRNTVMRVRHRQIEPLGRSGHYLLHAVARWRDAVGAAVAAQRLAVHLYGRDDPSHRRLVAELGIGELVTVHGYVAHRDAVAALSSAHGVFVPLHQTAPGERALVVPGKLYEALASERPVLAALPPGDGADLVRNLAAGLVVSPTDITALQRALADMVDAWQWGSPLAGCPRRRLAAFARRDLTRRLATVLEAAVARRTRLDLPDPWVIAESA